VWVIVCIEDPLLLGRWGLTGKSCVALVSAVMSSAPTAPQSSFDQSERHRRRLMRHLNELTLHLAIIMLFGIAMTIAVIKGYRC
jgi:hypothetical protein